VARGVTSNLKFPAVIFLMRFTFFCCGGLFQLLCHPYLLISFLHAADSFYLSRPGILVLINDADWELEGEEKYELQAGDNILFVSTLHGG